MTTCQHGAGEQYCWQCLQARLALAEAYIEALEQNLNDFVDLKTVDEAIAWRAAVSASVVQYKPCEICTTQSWCETHGCQCYPVSAVQPERCCLDYPRCDCNSPPEPDSAPTLQPCGHPWKAQHDFKCILCSSPGDATYAQLAEEQGFRRSTMYWYERAMKAEARLQKVMARCADLLDEDQFNELDAMTRTTVTVMPASASGGE